MQTYAITTKGERQQVESCERLHIIINEQDYYITSSNGQLRIEVADNLNLRPISRKAAFIRNLG